jgi:hypothetical protein
MSSCAVGPTSAGVTTSIPEAARSLDRGPLGLLKLPELAGPTGHGILGHVLAGSLVAGIAVKGAT